MEDLLKYTPEEFVKFLHKKNIRRCCLTYDESSKTTKPSHKALQPIADFLNNDTRDFNKHEGVFLQVTEKYNFLQSAFVHRTVRGQAAGGSRFWRYDSMEDFLRDGLRLSQGMTHKNALAGLWWGGGKGVIARNNAHDFRDPELRKSIFQEYGTFISSLQGCYVTAEDVGTAPADVDDIFANSRFTTCISPEKGGSGNPSDPTARGVARAMEAALHFLDGGGIEGRTVAIQGLGHVGFFLIADLLKKGVGKIVGCDINSDHVTKVQEKIGGEKLAVKLVDKGDVSIFSEPCDVFAPCATGGVLNPETIPMLRTKIVCGAANNQLKDPVRDDKALFDRGVLYVPDFLANRMGIVHCANEQYGYVNNDPAIEQHLDKEWDKSVYQMTLKVLARSKETGETPGVSAVEIADKLSCEPHPIWGHRGRQIIQSLLENRWAE